LTQALTRLNAWPEGAHRGISGGRIYMVVKTTFAQYRAIKLVAHELGGTDYISLNLYHLTSGPLLKPCEMPVEKVVQFLADLRTHK